MKEELDGIKLEGRDLKGARELPGRARDPGKGVERQQFLEEVENLSRFLSVPPAREIPEEVSISEVPKVVHARSSSIDGKLIISREFEGHIHLILKKEAFSLFIPEEADSVPQVHDMSWIYAEAPKDLWYDLRATPPRLFSNYDPVNLFSQLGEGHRKQVLKSLLLFVRASALRGQLTFSTYFALLLRFLRREYRLRGSERRIVEMISRNPYLDTRDFKMAGLSSASVSRALRNLRTLGFVFGPDNVDLSKLGLITIVADYPNSRGYVEAFWEFPFTYTQLIPISSSARVHSYILIPRDAVAAIKGLSKLDVRVGVARVAHQKLGHEADGNLAEMALKNLTTAIKEYELHSTNLGRALSREDIRILNIALREGRVTEGMLRGEVGSPKLRLMNLRRAGIIRRCFLIEAPIGCDPMIFRVRCSLGEMKRLTETLASMSSVLTHYIEGDENYCLSVAFVRPQLKGELSIGMKAIYGDDLVLAEELIYPRPLWTLPEELWDEGARRFRWEGALESLIDSLSRVSRSL